MPPPPVQDLERVHEPAVTGARPPLAAAFRFVEPTWRNYIAYVDAEARTGNADAAVTSVSGRRCRAKSSSRTCPSNSVSWLMCPPPT